MAKREVYFARFARVEELKNRFRKKTSEWLRHHMALMGKEGAAAAGTILEECADDLNSN